MFEFTHNFYSLEGKHLSKSYLLGSWIDFTNRKMADLPLYWQESLRNAAVKDVKELTKQDLKNLPHIRQDLDLETLNAKLGI